MTKNLTWVLVLGGAAGLLAGCLSSRPLDRKVEQTVKQKAAMEPAVGTSTLEDALGPPGVAGEVGASIDLDLNAALRVACEHSRDLQTRRDTLYRSGLSLLRARHAFGVELSGTLDYVFARDQAGDQTDGATLTAGAGRVLPTGGKVTFSGQSALAGRSGTNGTEDSYASSLTLKLEQPLLAGAGYEASHESLTRAERGLLYAVREFALARADFAIDILKQYYALLLQRTVLENTRMTVKQASMLRARSEAMFKVGRAPAIDVLRAQQQELTSSNQLAQAEADFDVQQRRFVLALGLPVQTQLSLAGSIPERRAVHADESSCVAEALAKRVDLKTVRDEVEDARRRLRVARSQGLPELSAFGQMDLSSDGAERFSDQTLDDSYTAGLTLKLPLDKRLERYSIKEAHLDVGAAERQLQQKEDEVRLEARDNFTRLGFLANSVEIERRNIDIAEKRARNALQRFKSGELLNRDVVEAENELLSARNASVSVLEQYEIQRVELLRNAGQLEVARDGTLVEAGAVRQDE